MFLITNKVIINLTEIACIKPYNPPTIGDVESKECAQITLKNKETFIVNYTLAEISQLINATE